MKLHCHTTGSGPDLVLLHGWGMNAAVWSPWLPRLARHHRVTAIDLPGHGASDYDSTQDSLDDWVAACLEAAPRQADWVGWSLGGQLALGAGLAAPERIRRLVLVASSPRFVKTEDWPHAMEEGVLRQFAETLARNHQQTLERFLSLQVRGDEEARLTLRLLRQEIVQWPQPHPSALQQGLELLRTVDLRARIPGLQVPSLWLLGERDTLTPAAVGQELVALGIPQSEIKVLKGCAHVPFLSHPGTSLELVKAFLGAGDSG